MRFIAKSDERHPASHIPLRSEVICAHMSVQGSLARTLCSSFTYTSFMSPVMFWRTAGRSILSQRDRQYADFTLFSRTEEI